MTYVYFSKKHNNKVKMISVRPVETCPTNLNFRNIELTDEEKQKLQKANHYNIIMKHGKLNIEEKDRSQIKRLKKSDLLNSINKAKNINDIKKILKNNL